MDFKNRVKLVVKKIPKGKVASYGQIAAFAGHPKAARQVGGVLRFADVEKEKIPWWRVVNNQGVISIKGHFVATKEMQKKLLEKDGILVDKDLKVDMGKYRWKANTI
jgi:methylated-DNA-protein-cysteine methyltransferase related protein